MANIPQNKLNGKPFKSPTAPASRRSGAISVTQIPPDELTPAISVTENYQEETPLFGTISVTENPFSQNLCEFCGRSLPTREPGKAGRPSSFHPKCGQLSRSLNHLAKSVEQIQLTAMAAQRLKSSLFWISNLLQVPRDTNGRFAPVAKSRPSATSGLPGGRRTGKGAK